MPQQEQRPVDQQVRGVRHRCAPGPQPTYDDRFENTRRTAVALGILLLFVQINLVLMILNLIPIPPLDGSKILYALLDPRTVYRVRPVLEQYGLVILLGAMFLPIFAGRTLGDIIFGVFLGPLLKLLLG